MPGRSTRRTRAVAVLAGFLAANLIVACADLVSSPPSASKAGDAALDRQAGEGTPYRRKLDVRMTKYTNGLAVSQTRALARFEGRKSNGRIRGNLTLLSTASASRDAASHPAKPARHRRAGSTSRFASLANGEMARTLQASLRTWRAPATDRLHEDEFPELRTMRPVTSSSSYSEPVPADLPVYLTTTEVSNMLTVASAKSIIGTIDADSTKVFPKITGNPSSDTYLFKNGYVIAEVNSYYRPVTGGFEMSSMMIIEYDASGTPIQSAVMMVVGDEVMLGATDRVLDGARSLATRAGDLAVRVLAPRDALAQVACNDYMVHAAYGVVGTLVSVATANPIMAIAGMAFTQYHVVRYAFCKEAERRGGGSGGTLCFECNRPI